MSKGEDFDHGLAAFDIKDAMRCKPWARLLRHVFAIDVTVSRMLGQNALAGGGAHASQNVAADLNIQLLWLPKRCSELPTNESDKAEAYPGKA
ncbi:hypothetical protein [Polyangium jinanense]|uniref:Uncharacterized protein n=1 Tax=Polyangium jinanense TaxID=2829994 RepID=A0A9X4AU59_9BACT|nr:hypothetical protein [Polyangium jinanense]MDC3956072.1 hypothetical protein [Polyangium jinanense]MDC3982897.1 hypothetical protein [Polyangium jinanense]